MDHDYTNQFTLEELPSYSNSSFSTSDRSKYEWCFVPKCKNTAKNSTKNFCRVPLDINTRKRWFEKARREFKRSENYPWIFACEDHFELQNDVENLVAVRMGYQKFLKIKANVLPTFFNCQDDRSVAHSSKPRPLLEKRKQKELVAEAMACDAKRKKEDEEITEFGIDIFEEANLPELLEPMKEVGTQTEIFTKSKSTLTDKVKQGNKRIQFNSNKTFGKNKGTNTDRDKLDSTALSTPVPRSSTVYSMIYSSSSSDESSDVDEYTGNDVLNASLGLESYSSDTELTDQDKLRIRERMLKNIKNKPLTFLGIPQENIFLCEQIAKVQRIEIIFVFICLMKIRLDLSFDVLSTMFAYSSSHLARIFNSNIRGISILLKSLVYWPTPNSVKLNLPLPFRIRYKTVYCIIDCMEIEIQKPSDPEFQASTWSEYKKCNTAKYLVACTPQGFINFISSGYGGRITDAKIIEISGFLDYLQPGMQIMADRGFKSVDSLILKKGCTLVRPPSVYAAIKPSKEEVKETKRIASLRVIIENVIGRIRHFKLLSPHACVSINNLDLLDCAVLSACGLINLQSPVRKLID